MQKIRVNIEGLTEEEVLTPVPLTPKFSKIDGKPIVPHTREELVRASMCSAIENSAIIHPRRLEQFRCLYREPSGPYVQPHNIIEALSDDDKRGKLIKIAESLGKNVKEVRYGIEGPTMDIVKEMAGIVEDAVK